MATQQTIDAAHELEQATANLRDLALGVPERDDKSLQWQLLATIERLLRALQVYAPGNQQPTLDEFEVALTMVMRDQ